MTESILLDPEIEDQEEDLENLSAGEAFSAVPDRQIDEHEYEAKQ
ncbi:MAG: hypothetical protein NTZ53_02640 [Cyanobacteria bacterium]|nr:hypothetical protein [Cyanobacteriota bacterium]